ncbi:uncharacterized protein LOC144647079 isoform X2 [Oculina patagonica]
MAACGESSTEGKKKPRASSSGNQEERTVDVVQFLNHSASNATSLCNPEPDLDHDTAKRNERCAIHTKHFPGLCSPDCFDTMAAVSAILGTHTPLCKPDCDLQHHILTSAVFSPSVMFRADKSDIPLTFKLCLQTCFRAGWDRHMNVPDPQDSLRHPLLHLVCMSGNLLAATKLVRELKFKLDVLTESKETPLHLVVRHFPLTHADSKNINFRAILNFLTNEDQEMLFKADLQGDTVLHILAQCFNEITTKLAKPGDAPPDKAALVKQKNCYVKALKVCLHKLSDLQLSNKLCKKQICKLVHDRNLADKTMSDILQEGPDRVMAYILEMYAKEMLPYCFDDERQDLVSSVCPSSCPCSGKAVASGNLVSQTTQDCQSEEGDSSESPAQEPVSSSQSPPGNDDHSSAEVSQPQTAPDQPIQVQVAPACSPPRRPQAQVRSIQVIGQATAGNPSPQTSAAAQPVQHIPIVFIKQEPVDDEHDAQCLFSNNSQRQNAFIIHTGPAVASPVQTPSPLQLLENSVIQLGDTPPSNPPSLGQGSQAVTNAASSSNQLSAAGTQTTALLQQRAQTLRTPSVSQQGGQTTVAPIVSQTSLSQTGAAADQSGRQVSPKSKGVQSKRKSAESVQEMALKTLSRYTTDYRIEFQHTPFCDKDCSIDHNPLILTLLSTSNRLISRGPVNSFTTLLETSKANFLKCLKKNFDSGFVKYLDISDDLGILQYPLIHLAGIFFKYTTIEMLVHLGFERNPRSQRTGEFPLHSTLRHGYNTGLKLYKSFALNRNFEKLFAKVFLSFSNETDMMELLSQQDQNGDTPLHVAAKRMIERPAPVTSSPDVVASAVPDSTQECESSSSKRGESNDASQVCKLNHSTEQHRNRAEFYIHCLGHILKRLQEVATKSRKVDINLVKPVLLVKNNDGETFLQILCKEHHIANVAITSVINRFPHVAFINCVKQCVPQSCWPAACLMSVFKDQSASTTSGVNQSQAVSSPMELSKPSDKQSVARPSNPESPKPSSDVSMTQVSPTPSTTASVKTVGLESSSTPLAATPIQRGAAVVPPTPGSNPSDLLDSVLTPVVANPGHATLRPNTKRKIIEALREDYTERLELAVKGRHEVEEDILKHRSKTGELAVVIAKKREEMEKLERELQVLQKEMWHKNQAVQALENSLDQFTKEEEELQKNLAVLQDADPEPPTKKSKTQGNDNSDEDTRM